MTQMKATEQYFPVVLFVILYKVVLGFDSVFEILKSGYSVASRGADYLLVLLTENLILLNVAHLAFIDIPTYHAFKLGRSRSTRTFPWRFAISLLVSAA